MLLEKIKTPGLSHLSYMAGSGGKAAVIDPRRDCECYVEMARAEGLEITHIFETRRNEDLASGAPLLKELTGARVLHGPRVERSEEHTSELQSLMRISYAVFCLKKKNNRQDRTCHNT